MRAIVPQISYTQQLTLGQITRWKKCEDLHITVECDAGNRYASDHFEQPAQARRESRYL